MPSPLAINLAASFKRFNEEAREQQEQFLEQRRMLKTIGPKRWQELRELFRQTVAGVNTELGYALLEWEELSSNMLRISRQGRVSVLNGLYDPDTNTLNISSPNSYQPAAYEQKVLGDDVKFATRFQSENRPESPDEIVDKVLRGFLGAASLPK